jgi:hypothetical protein
LYSNLREWDPTDRGRWRGRREEGGGRREEVFVQCLVFEGIHAKRRGDARCEGAKVKLRVSFDLFWFLSTCR